MHTSISLSIGKHIKIQRPYFNFSLTKFNLLFWEQNVLSYHKTKADMIIIHTHTHQDSWYHNRKRGRAVNNVSCFQWRFLKSWYNFVKNLCVWSKSFSLPKLCVTGKPQWFKLLYRNWKESWIQWSNVCSCACVYITANTYTAQRQINNSIRLFPSHARPRVIQDLCQSVNNLPSNWGEILMMCLWVSAEDWSRANTSQIMRKFHHFQYKRNPNTRDKTGYIHSIPFNVSLLVSLSNTHTWKEINHRCSWGCDSTREDSHNDLHSNQKTWKPTEKAYKIILLTRNA